MASWAAKDWRRVVRQLEATLGSIYAQSDLNFRIIVVGTDPPPLSVAIDGRYEFIAAPQLSPMSQYARNMDGVIKRARAATRLRELGGGYLMLTDADDLLSRRLVEFVRRDAHPNGYSVRDGFMFDAGRDLLSEFPFPGAPGAMRFDQECGTSAVVLFAPEELPRHPRDDASRFARLMALGHPGVGEKAAAEGRPLRDLPDRLVCYVRNTGENISAEGAQIEQHHRLPFQAYLDDQVAAHAVPRTDALDAEFNLRAARAAVGAPPTLRRYREVHGLSVLIATHRRPEGLRRLLAALRPQVEGRRDREIIVVNDGSHDARYAQVAADFADVIRYEVLESNLGVVAARNAAVRLAAGAYGVFTDDDCLPPPWWLDWLSARIAMHPEVDVVVGTTRPRHVRRDVRERLQATWFIPRPWRLGQRDMFVTANVAIRLDLVRRVGGFGFPSFDGAGEDTELALRLHRARARFTVDHRWAVAHDVDATLRSLARKFRRYGAANAAISRLHGVVMPPPQGIVEVDGEPRMPLSAARLRDRWADVSRYEDGRAGRLAALAATTWILSAYVAGYRRGGGR
jgi:GT2 family glycosyltransferase